jgi:hypothetical protein
MSMAQHHVLVVDHSKFGKVRPARMGELKRFDTIISDNRPDDEFVEYAKAQYHAEVLEILPDGDCAIRHQVIKRTNHQTTGGISSSQSPTCG